MHASWCWHTTYSTMHPGAGMSVRHTAHSACILVLAHHLQYNASWCWYECTTHRSQCMYPGVQYNVSWCWYECTAHHLSAHILVPAHHLQCMYPGAGMSVRHTTYSACILVWIRMYSKSLTTHILANGVHKSWVDYSSYRYIDIPLLCQSQHHNNISTAE